jgi:hypothetical protein
LPLRVLAKTTLGLPGRKGTASAQDKTWPVRGEDVEAG